MRDIFKKVILIVLITILLIIEGFGIYITKSFPLTLVYAFMNLSIAIGLINEGI